MGEAHNRTAALRVNFLHIYETTALYDPLPVTTNFVERYRTGNDLLRLRLFGFGSGSGSGSGSKSGTGSRPYRYLVDLNPAFLL
jgi:hypothetical protein